LGESLPFW